MSPYIENFNRVLGQEGQRQSHDYFYFCPFPACAGKMKRKFAVNPDNGYWRCWRCGFVVPDKEYRKDCSLPNGGTYRDFVKVMGDEENIDLWPRSYFEPEHTEPKLSAASRRKLWGFMFEAGSLLPEDAEIVEARGIDPTGLGLVSMTDVLWGKLVSEFEEEMLVQGGMAFRNEAGKIKRRTCAQSGRILIPYFTRGLDYFAAYQPCPPREPDQSLESYQFLKDKWKKITYPAGYPSQIYGAVPEGAPYLIVTEGQWKAIAAQQRGFPCIGLPGVGNLHKQVVKLCQAAGVNKVILLFDSEADQDNVDEHAERLGRELLKAGIQPYQGRLSILEGETKADIDSFLVENPLSAFIQVLKEAGQRPMLKAPDWAEKEEENDPTGAKAAPE